jgi:catechol 2,3-dioxygenase-like lactoylglutathione lyase family enzyme
MADAGGDAGTIEEINAVTLLTADMPAAVAFYAAMGFPTVTGGPTAPFTTLRAGSGYLNLQLDAGREKGAPIWGRVIFFVADVDRTHARAVAAGYEPVAAPADASWGERYFHIHDPDGHELSFARPIR